MLTLPMPQVLRAMGLSSRTASSGDWSRHLVRLPAPGERANAALAALPPWLPRPVRTPAPVVTRAR